MSEKVSKEELKKLLQGDLQSKEMIDIAYRVGLERMESMKEKGLLDEKGQKILSDLQMPKREEEQNSSCPICNTCYSCGYCLITPTPDVEAGVIAAVSCTLSVFDK